MPCCCLPPGGRLACFWGVHHPPFLASTPHFWRARCPPCLWRSWPPAALSIFGWHFCAFGMPSAPHFWMARCTPFLAQRPAPSVLLQGPAPLSVVLVGTRYGPKSPLLLQGPASSIFGGPLNIHGFEGPNTHCALGGPVPSAFGGPGALCFWRTHHPPYFCGTIF